MSVHDFETNVARILIVEDEALLALDLAQSLGDFGYEVVGTAARADDAIREALACQPDLILMDIHLQGKLDGIDTYSQIREHLDIPVVYLTGYSERDVLERAKRTEPYGYLGKPVCLEELRSTLETALYKHEADKRVRESEERLRSVLNSIHDLLFVLNQEGVFTDCHIPPNLNSKLFLPPGEFIGQHYKDVLPQDVCHLLEAAIDSLEQAEVSYQFDYSMAMAGGHEWFSAKISRRQDISGRSCGVTIVCRDITERKKAERDLLEREALIRSISDNLPSGMIYQVTGQKDGSRQFTYLSRKVRDFYGCSPDDAIADAGLIYGRIHPEDRQRVFLEEEKAQESLSQFRTEVRLINPSGDVRWSYFASSPQRLEDGSTYWSGLEIDITERKRAEEALHESEQRFRDLYENLRDGMAEVDGKGRFVTCNPQFLRMLGYSFDELSELTYEDVTPARWHAMESRIALEQIDVRGYSDLYEKEYIHKNGTIFPVEIQTYLAKDRDGKKTGYWAFARDISDRKKHEEELRVEKEFTDNALNSQRDTFFLFDPSNGRAIRWNRAFNDITGYTDEEIATMPAPDSYYGPPDLRRAGLFVREVLAKGAGQIDLELVCKDGHKVPYEYICSPVKDVYGKIKYLISIGRDITDRKKAEEQIKASLREKEILLREIHHRVKNNLAVVSSLLRLQARYTDDETVRSMFKESEARIRSMALAHAQLYQTENLSQIESGKYLGSLLTSLRSFMGQLGGNILITSEFENIELQIDTAIPLGFILTELVSNVFKHGFPDGRGGKLKLSLHRFGEDDFELVVKDDGVGIPDNIDLANPKSCGLNLVDVFVRQICGTMEVRMVGGTEVRIRFPRA